MYRIVVTQKAQKDYRHWRHSGNHGIIKKISELLQDIAAHPYSGIGRPEMLKYDLSGKWSRRINDEHRLVYSVDEDKIEIHVLSMKGHYSR